MLLLTALAASAMANPPAHQPRPGLVRQATASVRIVSGAHVRFDLGTTDGPGAHFYDRLIRQSDGSRTPATLAEFP
jgi:hypothetical protein